jgi:hypothetical protein
MSLLTTLRKQVKFLLRDDFDIDLPAGAVNGTTCRTGQARMVTDTEGKLSVAGGKLVFSGGKTTPAYSDPAVSYPAVTRQTGLMLLERMTPNSIGISQPLVYADDPLWYWGQSYLFDTLLNICTWVVSQQQAGAYLVGNSYCLAIILRVDGALFLANFGNGWRLLHYRSGDTTATLYPKCSGNSQQFVVDTIRIPQRLWLPAPILSDGFSLPGVSDGKGHAEGVAGGLGSGGGGVEWQGPTWSVGSGLLKNTPGAGANLIVDGDMEAADCSAWPINATPVTVEKVATPVYGGSKALHIVADSVNEGVIRTLSLSGGWKKATVYARIADSATNAAKLLFQSPSGYYDPSTSSKTYGKLIATLRGASGNWKVTLCGYSAGADCYFDDASLVELNSADLFTISKIPLPTPDVIFDAQIHNLVPGTQAGIVLSADGNTDPQNCIPIYFDNGYLKLEKRLAGNYTTLQSQLTSFVPDAHLVVTKEGTQYTVYYNDVLIGSSLTITDSAIINNKYAGLFSTDEGNTFESAVAYARGSEGQYNLLDEFLRGDDDAGEVVITTTAATPVDLRLDLGGYNKPVLADWGDGTVETVSTGLLTHTYASQAARTIRLRQGSHWAGLTTWDMHRTDSGPQPGLAMPVDRIPRMIVNLGLYYCSSVTGKFTDLPPNLNVLILTRSGVRYALGYLSGIGKVKPTSLALYGIAMDQVAVDSALHELVAAQSANPTWTACGLTLAGNAAPSAAGVADADTLRSKGWTVTTA